MRVGPRIAIMAEFVSEKDNSTGYYWQTIIKWISEEFGDTIVLAPKTQNVFSSSKIEYLQFSSIRFGKKSVFRRILDQIFQVIGFFRSAFSRLKPGMVVITGTNPILLLLAMPIIKRLSRTKWILLSHDLYPENITISGLIDNNSVTYRILSLLFSFVYRMPDAVIVIGRDMAEMVRRKGVHGSRIIYQPNWVNADDVKPMLKHESSLIRDLGWESKVIFQYFGNMGKLQGIEELLRAIDAVKSPDARFLFCGGGIHAESVMKFCEENDNCHFISDHDYDRDEILASCDVAIVHLSEGMYGLGVPSKAYFSMASNRPILYAGDSGSELELAINESRIGWFANLAEPDSLSKTIQNILNKTASTTTSPLPIYHQKYDGRAARDIIIRLVHKVLNGGVDSIEGYV